VTFFWFLHISYFLDCYLPLSFSALSLSLSRSNFCRERFVLQTFLSEPKWNRSLIRPFQGAAASFPFFRGSESVPSGVIPSSTFRGAAASFPFFRVSESALAGGGGFHPALSGGRYFLSFFQGLRVRPLAGGIPSTPFKGAAASFHFFRGSESLPSRGRGVFHPPFQGTAAIFHFQGS
jgi:hypothetical protein